MTEMRALSDNSEYTCDWGHCDRIAVAERLDSQTGHWPAVCELHIAPPPARRSPGPGKCAVCGKTTALTVAGTIRAHDAGFATRCPGSGDKPTTPTEPTP